MMKRNLILIFLLLSCSLSIAQKMFSPKSYICYKINMPIIFDGRLDDVSWQSTKWTDYFVDIEGGIKPLPRFQTRVKMLWDAKYFYIAAESEEPNVWATLTERDAVIFYDNDFEVFIDPDGDTHKYYEFEMNAYNTVWDLLLVKPYRDGGPAINAWDIKGLESAVNISGTINQPGDTDNGWTIEVAFPWEVLKECANKNAPPYSGDQWRINFSRVEWKVEVKDGKYQKVINPQNGKPYSEDNWVWSPQGIINMHYPEMWGFVQFSDKVVGTGTDQFVFLPEENVKWVLRQIYYKEKKYFEANKKYTADLHELELINLKVEGYSFPVVQITSNLYEAVIVSVDGKTSWHISQDGRTWKE